MSYEKKKSSDSTQTQEAEKVHAGYPGRSAFLFFLDEEISGDISFF